jgi:hypothetical protein
MTINDVLGPAHLDEDRFRCCPNRDVFPFKCSQCRLPFAYCMECNTVYPYLPDTTRTDEAHNATDSSRPSHRCKGCGHAFEYGFMRNRKYQVTRAEWDTAGLGGLLRDAKDDRQRRAGG